MQDINLVNGSSLLFLVGAPRSGTTWLQLCLASSPHIATANETHLFSTYTQSLFRGWADYTKNVRDIGIHHLLGEDDFLRAVKGLTDAVLEKIAQKKPSARVILEKTPAHARCWQDIVRLYPQARFLHLVRDPRAVVASLRAAAQSWGSSWASQSVIENAWQWRHDVSSARSIRDSGSAYLEVRYEDLVAAPAEGLARILAWLGLPNETIESCAEYVRKIDEGKGDQPWDLRKEPPGFSRRRGVDGWRVELLSWQVRVIEEITSPLAASFGYFGSHTTGRALRLQLFEKMISLDRFWQWQKKKFLRYL